VWARFFARFQNNELDEFRDPEHLVAFLVGMAKIEVSREEQRRGTHRHGGGRCISCSACAGEDAPEIPDGCPSLIDALIAREEWNRVLEGHPAEHREIFRLRRDEGLSCEEIGELLGFSASQVRRILRQMRDEFLADMDEGQE
jgi:RNA polymerase sigma factor (sigma-70 family)